MIDGTYRIEIDTPLGRKPGTVALRADGDKALGDIDAPLIGKQSVEGKLEDENTFSAQGAFKLKLVGKVAYTLKGEVTGDTLRVFIESSKGNFELEGSRTGE